MDLAAHPTSKYQISAMMGLSSILDRPPVVHAQILQVTRTATVRQVEKALIFQTQCYTDQYSLNPMQTVHSEKDKTSSTKGTPSDNKK